MMEIVLASRNRHKIAEIQALISGVGKDIKVLSLDDIGYAGDIEENGTTFEENSAIKANTPVMRGYIGLADDSGLAVDALDGAPGVYSARYAGEPCDDKKNNNKLLEVLGDLEAEKRTAKFVSVVTVLFPKNSELYNFDESLVDGGILVEGDGYRGFSCRGECTGSILFSEQGTGGFGYDPLFLCDAYGKSYAELTPDEKNSISHRGVAMRKFVGIMAKLLSKQ